MKIFFWLLVAANVMLFALARFMSAEPVVEVPQAVHADKILIASEPVAASAVDAASAPVAAPVSSPASAPVAASAPLPASAPAPAPVQAPAPAPAMVKSRSCYEWGEFSGTDIEQVGLALKKLPPAGKIAQRETERSIGFWVYVPPLKDKAAAAEKIAQLKARGVSEYFVVQDAGEWQNAISLGVFKTRESAQNFLTALRAKGVTSAKLGERSGKNKSVTFLIDNLDAETSARLMVLQKDFAGSDLKRVTCH